MTEHQDREKRRENGRDNADAACCCYGKLPALGDFVHRGMSRRQIEVWDEWLQGCISESRRELGDEWLDYYLEAPVWYFAAGAGNIDQQTWIGVLIPSVDRVGRYFPFSVMREFAGGSPLDAMRRAREWYAEAETLALDCLDEAFEPGQLDGRLERLPALPGAGEAAVDGEAPEPAETTGRVYLLGDSPRTSDVLSAIADDTLLQLHPGYSVWWTAGSGAVSPVLLVASAMPDCAAFGAMLDGRFEDHGWAGARRIGDSEEAGGQGSGKTGDPAAQGA